MAINLLQEVQEKLGYQPLQKIDANTQEVMADNSKPDEERFSQAAIPAIIIALYEYTTADEAAEKILHTANEYNWLTLIFNSHTNEAVEKISAYSAQSFEHSLKKMNAIANEAVALVRSQLGKDGTALDVKNLLASQRNDVLPYLPARIQIGTLLNDSTIDDRTNKMQGPVSSLMHIIGNGLAGVDMEDEATRPS